jgi:hypothetical protein
VSDFNRLTDAFAKLARVQEACIAAKSAAVSAKRVDLEQLRVFLDRPAMMNASGYSEGLLRIVRSEAEMKRFERELAELRLEHSLTEQKRDRCIDRARQDAARAERRELERRLTEQAGNGHEASLAQPGND